MGTGYTRNDTSNNIADGNVINASDFDGEFDAIQSAFDASSGHSHDGTTGEGPKIDTGGLADDAVTAAILDQTATFTMAGLSVTGNTTLGDAASDTVTVNADIASDLIPSADGTHDLGATGAEWQDLFIDGTANIDSLVADTADINGGSIDGVTIGTNSVVTDLRVDNIKVDGNTVSSTDTNGDINLSPNGTGTVVINTDLDVDNLNINGNTIISTDTDGNIALTPNGTGSVVIDGLSHPQADGSAGQFLKTDGSGTLSFATVNTDLSNDTSPQLGGNLDTNGNDINVADNDKIVFGTGSDFEITHNTSNTVFKDTGAGNMRFQTTGTIQFGDEAFNETFAEFNDDGAVTLYHNNSAKLATDSGGVNVTGTLAATAVTGDGSGLTGIAPFPSGTSMLFQQTAAPTGWTKQTTHNDKALRIVTGSVSTGGSVAFSTAFGTPSVSGSVSISGAPGVGNLAGNTTINGNPSVSGNISSTTLSINQIPSHSHTYVFKGGGGEFFGNQGGQNGSKNTGNKGGSGSHNHGHNLSGAKGNLAGNSTINGAPGIGNLAGSLSSSTATINVNYVDFIIANKD